MVAVKTKRISTLIETQLPEFISTEYELFSKFVTKYYEAQEVQGGTLDIINNIQKYADIDYYEKNLLRQHDTLDVSINSNLTSVMMRKDFYPQLNSTFYYEVCFQNAFDEDCDDPVLSSTGFRVTEYPNFDVYVEDRDKKIVLYRLDLSLIHI